jgi:pimeloyl-ACP methyl ester carboxylesterase
MNMTNKPKVKADTQKIPQSIVFTAQLLEKISPKLATAFAAKLFVTPIKHKIPKREWQMDGQSKQSKMMVPKIQKEIHLYRYGTGSKKVLLVHGWSGRGTQLFKIADLMVGLGYEVISFDAPAHGKSSGNSSIMLEFIASIHEINQLHGPFDLAIGHSLGGMAILNAIKENFKVEKSVIIGTSDIITDIVHDFTNKLGLKEKIAYAMQNKFERKYQVPMNDYSGSRAAQGVKIPVLVIHDAQDGDAPVQAAHQICQYLEKHELMITTGLGHRKVLGDEAVLERIRRFVLS